MRLLLLEGANSIGGTKIYFQEGGVGLLIDFGINYQRWGQYFEEYLKPRPGRGLYDLWQLDLIPKVKGLYRQDLIPKGFQLDYEHSLECHALFLSHAHLDHCGLVGLVRGDLPLYTSALTAAIMKARQDVGNLDFYAEMAYWNPRSENAQGMLKTDSREPYWGRLVRIVDREVSEALQDFWRKPPNPTALEAGSKAKQLETQPLQPANGLIEGLRFQAYPVDHSIPGATAFAFETEEGLVVYTGDFRLHGKQTTQMEHFIRAIADQKPYLLIVEGTRLGREGDKNVTEDQVRDQALQLAQRGTGRLLIADFGTHHIERLQTFLEIARATSRQLLLFTKDGYLLESVAKAEPDFGKLLEDSSLAFFDELRLTPKGWEKDFRQRYQRRLVSAEEVQKKPEGYLLAFSFYDMTDLLDIRPQDGVYLYSSSEAYTEDQRVDLWRLWNWLRFYRMKVHGFRWEGEDERGQVVLSENLHASGHVSPAELRRFICEVQPRYLLPVHTHCREWFVEKLKGEPIQVVLTGDQEWFQR